LNPIIPTNTIKRGRSTNKNFTPKGISIAVGICGIIYKYYRQFSSLFTPLINRFPKVILRSMFTAISMAEKEKDLIPLFEPDSIAIVGASSKKGKVGNILLSNIVNSGYDGDIYPINPKGGEIYGKEVYGSIDELPEGIDLGIVVIPAKYVREAVQKLGEKGIKHTIVITSGFSEIGNTDEENLIVEEAGKHGMRILGPNVFGIYSAKAELNATFGPSDVSKGEIALISQSGALGIAMIGKTAMQ